MNGVRPAATLVLAAVLAAVAVAPASAAPSRPTAKTCKKKGTVLVKTGRTKRCVKLRIAPPRPKQADTGQLALDFLLSPRWPALRDRRGRRVPSLSKRLSRAGRRAAPALRRAYAKGLALVAARRAATARAAQGSGIVGVSDGNSIGFNGEIKAGDVTIFVEFRTTQDGRIRGEDCPTGAGRLEGSARPERSLSIRLVDRDRKLISGYSATFLQIDEYQAQTADDAKLDTLTIDHESTVKTTIYGDHAPLSVRMETNRRAQVDMRTGTYTPSERRLDVQVRFTGIPADVAAELDAAAARQLQGETDREFAEVVSSAMAAYRSMESRFNQDSNDCVTMRLDPRPDERRYQQGERGRFSAWMEPTVDRGSRPNGIYRRVDQLNVEGSPAEATGTQPAFEFVVVTASSPAWVRYRATSKAGVAVGTHDVRTQPNPTYKVVGMAYTDRISADNIYSYLGCTYSSAQNNTTTFTDSGMPVDGAVGPMLGGEVGGSIFAHGEIGKYAEFRGCKWNDTASARESCTLTGTGTERFLLATEIQLPPGEGPAQVKWYPRAPSIGDVPPTISPCEPMPLTAPTPDPVVTHVPRATFLDPGTHTISLDLPATVPAAGGIGTINSTARYAITFKRVNQDGSPYTG